MKRALLVVAIAAGAALVPSYASASSTDILVGGCGYDEPAVTGVERVGVIDDVSIAMTRGLQHQPIGATVTCWITVNGVEAPGTRYSFSGFGVQAGAHPVSFTASDIDIVTLCWSVDFADGTSYEPECLTTIGKPLVPWWITDDENIVLGAVDDAEVTYVDPVVCPALEAARGSYGPVTVAADGDVYIADPIGLQPTPYYDCPPYRNF